MSYLVEVSADRAQPPARSDLRNRHLQFMAIGGVIGAGFFLGSGVAISKAGPVLLLAYVLAGAVVFLMMRALGELSLAYPSRGSFSRGSRRRTTAPVITAPEESATVPTTVALTRV